ncbi:uncharacterized protein LOC119375652 isoform X2 [Rhipicephalus sanguineus]|uniref:uncharacterized protein LOC119375652 isoform X1 n=1 Tax=Rhipicephalus sanguineus TaxID=34632 RepID=UPI0018952108|nr:uncharacterized protein LOC119375652 isoform X1 [Rhipicephalus sanguineus]XP_049276334.1 uncharacterized protein LOC119375652 isoform X2 [Rhipicephalus sanguineus]
MHWAVTCFLLCATLTSPALLATAAAARDGAPSGELTVQDTVNEVHQVLPVFGRMLRPALQSALDLLSRHVSYNVLGALAVLLSSVATLVFWFPGTLGYVGFTPGWYGNRSEDSVSARFDAVLKRYNVDPDACLKVAMCSVGRLGADAGDGHQNKQRRQAGPVEVLDSMLSLTFMDEVLLSRSLRSARQVGEAGGDCDSFNRGGRCPFNAAAWRVLLSTINRSLA